MSEHWDTSNKDEFVAYYVERHERPETTERFRAQRNAIVTVYRARNGKDPADVCDIGCNAGANSRVWAELGCRVTGIDISSDLVEAARQSAHAAGLDMDLRVGSATELPFPEDSFDVAVMSELLEHVTDWRTCLDEGARILRPGGILVFSTTNVLCPFQSEFNLPMYSWYPGCLKRRFERLAVTTRPELANHATYPAIHWFSPYGLGRYLRRRGLVSLDRFDVAALTKTGTLARLALWLIRHVPGLRILGHVLSPGTSLMACRPMG